jgi:predicted nucleotidyltransferase component of viral defense system
MRMNDIENWVTRANSDIEFRQAIHTFIIAIANSPFLNSQMIMKGGILLAIRFAGNRFTKDIDFSTDQSYSKAVEATIIDELTTQLTLAVESLNYGLDMRIQNWKINPANSEASFPTLTIKIGYAYKGTKKHLRLMLNKSPSVISIDYSFNETNQDIDTIEIPEVGNIKAYSLHDLVAEKYRAIIQQPLRNRFRRQDAYDIFKLIENGFLDDYSIKHKILVSLIIKARSRGINVNPNLLDDEDTQQRSGKEYDTLGNEIEGILPPFELMFNTVKAFYKSLPWENRIIQFLINRVPNKIKS